MQRAVFARELDRALIGFRARIGEEHLVEAAAIDQRLRQLQAGPVVERRARRQQQFCLRRQRFGDDRRRMAEAIDRPALDEIEIALAAVIPQERAFAADEHGRRARGDIHQGVKGMGGDVHVETPSGWMKKRAKTREGRTFPGAAFSKTLLISYSALSSDTARPIIVERATTESGAELGPGEDHGEAPYSRRARRCQADQNPRRCRADRIGPPARSSRSRSRRPAADAGSKRRPRRRCRGASAFERPFETVGPTSSMMTCCRVPTLRFSRRAEIFCCRAISAFQRSCFDLLGHGVGRARSTRRPRPARI